MDCGKYVASEFLTGGLHPPAAGGGRESSSVYDRVSLSMFIKAGFLELCHSAQETRIQDRRQSRHWRKSGQRIES